MREFMLTAVESTREVGGLEVREYWQAIPNADGPVTFDVDVRMASSGRDLFSHTDISVDDLPGDVWDEFAVLLRWDKTDEH